MFNVALVGDKELVARFTAMPAAVRAALDTKVQSLALELQKLVVLKLSGRVLNVRSGALRRSIQQEVQRIGTAIWGKVFSSGDVKYAGIHEFGGTIKHPGGTAYMTAYAAAIGMATWIRNDNPLAAHLPRTKPHDIKMPKRSFLRSSLKDSQATITREFKEVVVGALMQQAGMA